MTIKNEKMTSKSIQKTTAIISILVLIAASATIMSPISNAEATKTRNCVTGAEPKGVQAIQSLEVWVANAVGGTLQKFTNLNTDCTKTTYTVVGDPYGVDRSLTTQVVYSSHAGNKIYYFDQSTSTITATCTSSNISSPQSTAHKLSTEQFTINNANGKVTKTVKSGSTCTVTAYTIPPSFPRPEDIEYSSDIDGFFVVDQSNLKLYKMSTTGTFTLCQNFALITGALSPYRVDVNDGVDLVYVSHKNESKLRAVGTACGGVVETSTAASAKPVDVAFANGANAYAVFETNAKVGKYTESTNSWTYDDWNTECSSCLGFGIDSLTSSNKYYATMSSGSTNKIVVGTQ